jgi:hypothetical protein
MLGSLMIIRPIPVTVLASHTLEPSVADAESFFKTYLGLVIIVPTSW